MARAQDMIALVWTANVLGWPAIHLAIGRAVLHIPSCRFEHDIWLTRERRWERDGRLYRRVVRIHRWKKLLPDGAPWLGGMQKKRLAERSSPYLRAFVSETRRAELAHWCMLLCAPVFILWNPPWACLVMVFYGIAANLPCILAQRANRIQISRMLRRYGQHTVAPSVLSC